MAAKLKLNIKGFRQLRTSSQMDSHILGLAKKVANRAGDGYRAELSPGVNRARAVVVPDTAEAAMETAKDPHRLVSALDAAR